MLGIMLSVAAEFDLPGVRRAARGAIMTFVFIIVGATAVLVGAVRVGERRRARSGK
jgi:hypothetical protein